MTTPTSQPEEYDVLILGSGAAGKLLSWTFAKKGMRTAAIERKYVGGSCPNIACLPSKNIIHSAKVVSYFFRSEEFGISKDNTRINMAAVRDTLDPVSATSRRNHRHAVLCAPFSRRIVK
jgi:pyruvate/2-oxoglutarate dehydrogenase complex dihydrolipoamide dehydrogenase (E3) component